MIKKIIDNPQFKYIAITFFVSAIGFFKTFIILKLFDFKDLGTIAFLQTSLTTISLLHFGIISGGYRLFSYKKADILKKINSAVLFFFIFLSLILCFGSIIIGFLFNLGVSIPMLLLFALIGIVSLYSNWVTCKLLATKNLQVLNKGQILSTTFSFILVVCSKWIGGVGLVLVSFFIQPMILICLAYVSLPALIPKVNIVFFYKYIKIILFLGFVPYLTTALALFNSQVGRWFITISLGKIILGKTFLVSIFTSLVSVFPNAISNLYFPKIIQSYELGDKQELSIALRRQTSILLLYFIIVIFGTLLFANPLVTFFLPKHIVSIDLVYSILPSLIFLNLSSPIIIFFNATKKFKQILIGGLVMVFCYCMLLLFCYLLRVLSLINFFIIESISAGIFFIYNIYFFIKFFKS